MFSHKLKIESSKPMLFFCIGFCLVLMSAWMPGFYRMDVFMQFWRVEIAASLFLVATLGFLLYRHSAKLSALKISRQEINFIVLPLTAFVCWSALSMIWSPSWKLALTHTLLWTEYLIFYLLIRQILETAKAYKLLIASLTAMFLIVAVPAIFEYASFIYFGGTTSLGIRYAKYGEQVLLLFPLVTIGVLRLRGRAFILGVLIMTAMELFMFGTLSRTNLLLFAAALIGIIGLIFAFRQFHRYRRRLAWAILAMILAPVFLHSITLLTEEASVPIVNRVSDETGMNYSSNFRKLMISVSLEAAAAHPLVGIGAGNYGTQFNNYRLIYADKNPTDGNLTVAEDELAERSHNEYLQIFAELGIVGSLIFLWFLSAVGVMVVNALRRWRRVPLLPLAALLGLALFLASSAVTSYSFRFLQNGLIFFFVLAVAAKFLLSSKFEKKPSAPIVVSNDRLRFGYVFGIAVCLLLFVHCSVRLTSVFYTARANRTADIRQAASFYQAASESDDENPNPDYFYGVRLIEIKQPAIAVPFFQRAIALGLGTSDTYSYLATAQTLAGDFDGAENTFAEAARLYPHSAFVRTRYAFVLQNNGKISESKEQLNLALRIDKKSANTWWSLMNDGVSETTRRVFGDKDFAEVMDLKPAAARAAVLTERQVKFPTEKVAFNFDR